MTIELPTLIRLGGVMDWSVLVVAFILPVKLELRRVLQPLPPLVRQLFWTYGAYTVMSIAFIGLMCVVAPHDMATTLLGRLACGYIAVFWTLRVVLQCFFQTRVYVTHWLFAVGEALLTVNFVLMAILFIVATFRLV